MAVLGVALYGVNLVCAGQREGGENEGMASSEFAKGKCDFELTKLELRALVDNTRKIQIGDSRQAVKDLLGEASTDLPISPKAPARETVGRIVKYYAQQCDKNVANNNDKVVTFVFDRSDRLIRITSNIVGIKSKP